MKLFEMIKNNFALSMAILFLFFSFGSFLSGGVLSGILLLLTGLFISPLRNRILKIFNLDINLKKRFYVPTVIVIFFVAVALSPTNSNSTSDINNNAANQSIAEETVIPTINDNKASAKPTVKVSAKPTAKVTTKPTDKLTVGLPVESTKKAEATKKPIDKVDSNLEIHYIDVGQGDCTLITCDGKAMLIDAGDNSKGTAVQLYLSKQGISKLDYVIGTHPDADHIGGLDVVISKFECGKILLTNETKDTSNYRDVINAIKYKNYSKTQPSIGDEYKLGSAKFTIVAPKTITSDSNNNSIAFVLQHGENKFYFEGDAEEEEEASILSTGINISANVFKIGHHGSKTSTSDAILSKVNPQYAVISVGEGNSYGHPNSATLNKLRAKGIKVFRTDEQGAIVATSDGTSIKWNCSPTDSWQAGEATGGSSSSNKATVKPTQNSGSSSSSTSNSKVKVHITETGSKYHSAGCSSLRRSDEEVTLEKAKSLGLTPCSRCNPPQ